MATAPDPTTIVRFTLTGIAPLILHNGQLANPRAAIVKEIKEYTGKKKKTDYDHDEIARLEWTGSLYKDDDDDLCITADAIDKMLEFAGARLKMKEQVKIAAIAVASAKLLIDGKKVNRPERLWGDRNYMHEAMKCVMKKRILRTRPIFREWACTIEVQLDQSEIGVSKFEEILSVGGRMIGFGDERPRMGRFSVKRSK